MHHVGIVGQLLAHRLECFVTGTFTAPLRHPKGYRGRRYPKLASRNLQGLQNRQPFLGKLAGLRSQFCQVFFDAFQRLAIFNQSLVL